MYAGGNTGVRDFMTPLGVTGYKLGLSGRREVDERFLDLRARKYAAIVADITNREATIHVHTRGHEWFRSPLPDPVPRDNQDENGATIWVRMPPRGVS